LDEARELILCATFIQLLIHTILPKEIIDLDLEDFEEEIVSLKFVPTLRIIKTPFPAPIFVPMFEIISRNPSLEKIELRPTRAYWGTLFEREAKTKGHERLLLLISRTEREPLFVFLQIFFDGRLTQSLQEGNGRPLDGGARGFLPRFSSRKSSKEENSRKTPLLRRVSSPSKHYSKNYSIRCARYGSDQVVSAYTWHYEDVTEEDSEGVAGLPGEYLSFLLVDV
jgi:hypothetical protein